MASNNNKSTIKIWLFNPFTYCAGGTALAVGLAATLAACAIGSLSNTHFDGVIDVHPGKTAPLWVFLTEGLINWLCLATVLIVTGLFVAKSRFRAIDVFGTQALARWPMLLTSIALLPPGVQRCSDYVVKKAAAFSGMDPGPEVIVQSGDAVFFAVGMLAVLVAIVWTVALMYRAYSVSCDVRGPKAIWSFVAGLIIAEVISNVIIIFAFKEYITLAAGLG